MSNRNLLILTLVMLAGLLLLVVVQADGNSHKDTIGENIDEAVEEVQDEIDDHTTSQ